MESGYTPRISQRCRGVRGAEDSVFDAFDGGSANFTALTTRLSIAYDQHVKNFKLTNKPDGGETSKVKQEIDASSISLSAARVFGNGVFVGARLVSHDYEVMFDLRDQGGEKTSGSEAISEFQVSAGFADADYEVALEYVPPIHVREDEVGVARPVTWTLNYRRKMGGMDALAGYYHALYSAMTDTLKNRQAVTLGGLWETGFGSFSGLLNYATKFHSETEYGSYLTIAN